MNTSWLQSRAANLLLWVAPVFFLLWLYWDGLQGWFLADDFAWLSLIRLVHSPGDLLSVLFSPAAQGTIRPWSERGFFLLFEKLFGLDALPFRIMVFATMAADLILLAWLTRRITHSRLGGFLAAVVWCANTSLVSVMSWSSTYNQALCPFFMLSALALFIRYAETGRRAFWWGSLSVFVLGFGALEINVVYPALAAAWVVFVAPAEQRRKLLRSLIPLVLISVVYFVVHRAVAPLPASGPYALHFDQRIFKTLALYGKWSLTPVDWEAFGHSHRRRQLIIGCQIAALLILVVSEIIKRRRIALFFVSWYVISLAPVLPLPDHHTDYYVTIPAAGLAMLAAWGFSCAWRTGDGRQGRAWQIVAAVAVIAYLAGMIPVSLSAGHWWLQKSLNVRALVLGVDAAHQTHPGKVILLDGVTNAVYTDSVGQGALDVIGVDFAYLTPGSEANIQASDGVASLDKTVVDPAVALHALQNDQVVVYSIAGDHLRNITKAYERSAPNRLRSASGITAPGDAAPLPERVDVGNPLYSWLLGPSWLPPESGIRWMPAKATVRLRGAQPGNKLLLEGSCPEEQLKQAARHLILSVGGILVGETQINDPETDFHRLFAIPSSLYGRGDMDIEIRVDPVTRKDGQEYGLVFGKIALLH